MRRLALLAFTGLLITACGSSSAGAVEDRWILVSGSHPDGEIRTNVGATPTLRLDGGEIGGESHCNIYGGRYEVDEGGRFGLVEGLAVTERACLDTDAMEAERRYLEALGAVYRWSVDGNQLILSGDGYRLVFEPDSSAPGTTQPSSGDPEDPVSSRAWFPTEALGSWRLERGSIDGEPIEIVASYPITLTVFEDSFGGTVCNEYGHAIPLPADGSFPSIIQTEKYCTREGVMESEAAYLSALQRFESAYLAEGRLVVKGEGVELVYVATAVPYQPGVDQELDRVVDLARADLSERENVDADEIQVVEAGRVTWSDGSLGCPQPGMIYTQALVDGWRVVLGIDEDRHHYHSGPNAEPFPCASPASGGTVPPGYIDR